MVEYSEQEKDEIIRDYFGPLGDEENPRCPCCGEILQFKSNYGSGADCLEIRVSCPDCKGHFTWEQNQPEQPWKPLHLQYFVERYKINQPMRCPFDDCYVTCAEFADGVLEFRCPYCNQRGRAQVPP